MRQNQYKLIVFDIDGTLTDTKNSWLHVHSFFNTLDNKLEIYKDEFFNKNITYKEFCDLECIFWKGYKEVDVHFAFTNINAVWNLYSSLIELKQFGLKLAAISSGLQFVPRILKLHNYFDDMFYNELIVKNGILTGEVNVNVDHTKIDVFYDYISKHNILDKEVIFVGDGENDICIAKNVGYSIAFNSNSNNLKKYSSCVINNNDFGFLKNYIFKIIT